MFHGKVTLFAPEKLNGQDRGILTQQITGKSSKIKGVLGLRALVVSAVALRLLGCTTTNVPERLQVFGYQGHVNEHRIYIQAPASRIFRFLTDFDKFSAIVPSERVRLTKLTPGYYGIGTIIRTETIYKIKMSWNCQVVEMQDSCMIVLKFQDGIFRGGYEVWEILPEGSGTCLSHTIIYNTANILYHCIWVLKRGENKHDALVEATLLNLKRACENEFPDSVAM